MKKNDHKAEKLRAHLRAQIADLRVKLREQKELARINHARAKAAERALDRVVNATSIAASRRDRDAASWLSPDALRAWAFGPSSKVPVL